MNNTGLITAVGLGPGDAELITLKGYKALQEADIIFYPASSVTENTLTSFSLQILDQLNLDVPIKALHIPMKAINNEEYYLKAYRLIKKEYDSGLKVVVVSEGDILFYSTFGYLWKYIQEDGLNHRIIPGIPAFIAGGGQGNKPLVKGTESIHIIPCPDSLNQIKEELKNNRTLVVMKLSKIKNWDTFFENLNRPFMYAERIGTTNQFVTNKPEEMIGKRIPYFALLIIYNKEH